MATNAGDANVEIEFDLDGIITKLLNISSNGIKPGDTGEVVSLDEIKELIRRSGEILLSEPTLLEIDAPVKIVGDIHGQFIDLMAVFRHGGDVPHTKYLFLGNYFKSCGYRSVDVMCLLLAYKIKYPDSIYLLRGVNENRMVNRYSGFLYECKRRYNVKLWKNFNSTCFDNLSIAALVGKKVFCCHGGLSSELDGMDKIRDITKPVMCPEVGLLCDLMWSEPVEDISGYTEGDRGVKSFKYGPDVVSEFIHKHDLSLIVRGRHIETFDDGFTYFADGTLVCLVSVPNLYGEFNNKAAILSINQDLILLRC